MKIFTKKCILQKTIIAVLMVLCINFIVPTYSHAGIGGVLINPILDLAASLGDIFEALMQWSMTGQMAAKEKLSQSNILVDQDDSRIKHSSEAATISVTTDELDLGWFTNSDKYQVPIIKYTPEEIFSNKIPYLDVNFISPKWTKTTSEYKVEGSASILQETISEWYIALRNLAIVGLLCVLVYVGIRILLSSTAGDKAKFKQMFTDWLIALCLLFFLHYIMSFTLVLVDSVNDALVEGNNAYTAESVVIEVDGAKYATNFMGAARFMVQSKDTAERFGYMIIYVALVAYTAVFTWHYLKRVLMMAFLTIIAPLVALTYPIDKIGDGKAQAFNMWLKEYVYNALIQPFHLIIYMVFVGSAMDLAKVNLIYGLAAIGFILPAEKILKKMFGFDRAPLGTMGALTGFTVGSLASKLGGKGSSGGAKGGNVASKGADENKPPRYERHHGTDGIDYKESPKLGMGQGEEKDNKDDLNNRAKAEFEQQEDLAKSDGDANKLDSEKNEESKDNKEEQTQKEPRMQLNNEQGELDKSKQEQSIDKDIKEAGRIRQGVRNVVSAHGGGKRIALKGAKTLGRAAKFTARTALTASGTLAGAAAGLASGKGLAGVIAGATAGKAMGNKLGRTVSEMPEKAYNTASRIGKGAMSTIRTTADTFNGNTNFADKARTKAFMKDASTEQYIRDKWTKEHEGKAPSRADIKKELEQMEPYANEGLTDAAAIYRARKAEKFGVSAPQSAKIAALAKDRNITSDVLGDEKKFNQRKEDFTQEFIDKGFSNTEATKQADYVLNVMKAQVGQRHNLGQKTAPITNTNNTVPKSSTNPRMNNNNTKPRQNANNTAPRSNTKPRTTKGNNTKK